MWVSAARNFQNTTVAPTIVPTDRHCAFVRVTNLYIVLYWDDTILMQQTCANFWVSSTRFLNVCHPITPSHSNAVLRPFSQLTWARHGLDIYNPLIIRVVEVRVFYRRLTVERLKVKRYSSPFCPLLRSLVKLMKLHLRATGCHLPDGITVIPATQHKWTHPALTPVRQAGTRFTYPGGMEGWVDLGDWLHTEMVLLPADGHEKTLLASISLNVTNMYRMTQNRNHYKIHKYKMVKNTVSLALNSRPVDHKSDALSTTLPNQNCHTFLVCL